MGPLLRPTSRRARVNNPEQVLSGSAGGDEEAHGEILAGRAVPESIARNATGRPGLSRVIFRPPPARGVCDSGEYVGNDEPQPMTARFELDGAVCQAKCEAWGTRDLSTHKAKFINLEIPDSPLHFPRSRNALKRTGADEFLFGWGDEAKDQYHVKTSTTSAGVWSAFCKQDRPASAPSAGDL